MGKEKSRVHFLATALGISASVAFAGCGDSNAFSTTTAPGVCANALTRLQQCSLATTGTLRHDAKVDPVTACKFECLAKGDCAELQQYLCQQNPLGTLLSCIDGCTTFQCGDGTRIDVKYRCDGAQNCSDGSDEAGCIPFTCTDGTKIPSAEHCDYKQDCPDNSDESGCPSFTCANGQKVPESSRCNGTADCLDQTDESGCPTYTCANGQPVIGTAHCDGRTECTDGSDELNCPPEPSAICNGQSTLIGDFFAGSPCN